MKKSIFFASLSILTLVTILTAPITAFAISAGSSGFCQVGGGGFIKVPCPQSIGRGPAGKLTFGDLVIEILDIALLVVGALAVLFLIIGGFRYITAYGNEEAAEAAKKIIQNAVLGLVIVLLSFAIVTILTNVLVLGQP